MYCKNCGHELKGNENFCAGCGQPITQAPQPQTNTTQNKKQTNPFKRLLKTLLIIILVPVALAVLFFIGAIIAALIGRGSERAETNSNSMQTPIATIAATATPTVAPTIAQTETPEATPEITPEPTLEITNADILEAAGIIICGIMEQNNIEGYYIHDENQLIICIMYEYSFDACKSMGAATFALAGWEDVLKDVYNNTVEVANSYGATNYYASINLWSSDQKTIMSYSSAGVDYNIK